MRMKAFLKGSRKNEKAGLKNAEMLDRWLRRSQCLVCLKITFFGSTLSTSPEIAFNHVSTVAAFCENIKKNLNYR